MNMKVKVGDKVILDPKRRADVFDLALRGMRATVVSTEEDFEGQRYLVVTLDEDPGRDLGWAGQNGHRFFFHGDEVMPVPSPSPSGLRSVLIAGIGNILKGDDGFGSEVARELSQVLNLAKFPFPVRVEDFGIRGWDLSYALEKSQDDVVILIDVLKKGGSPGTLYFVTPALNEGPGAGDLSSHGMDPFTVLQSLTAQGKTFPCLRLLGCEPEKIDFEDDEFDMGLSPCVERAVKEACAMIESFLEDPFLA